jgi:hypothetical protein
MSRLDSFIRRMQAQRACLDHAASLIRDLPGPVLELGLGNGRTYDHLRETLPDREIYVFDRRVKAHPDCIPPDDRLFLGEVADTLPEATVRLGATAALVHTDLGTGDAEANAVLADLVGPLIDAVLRPGGVVVANHALTVETWRPLPLPEGVKPGRYFLYEKAGASG